MPYSLEDQLKLFEPRRFEELCAQLVKQDFPAAWHVEGAGGDEGIDIFAEEIDKAMRVSAGYAVHVWQVKFFRDGVKHKQREKAENSLKRAVQKHGIQVWTLCIPVNLDMKGQEWLKSLRSRYPDITIDCWQADEIVRRVRQDESIVDNYFVRSQPAISKDTMLSPQRGIIQNLPFLSLGSLFKGREKDLEKLDKHLFKHSATAIVQPHTISGLGGIGKTRLSVEYAWRRENEFTAILFVRADTPDTLSANLASLVLPDILDLPDQKLKDEGERRQAVLRWLQQHSGWLLILDNADTRETAEAVEALIPKIPSGRVIITSRLTEWSGAIQRNSLDVILLSDAKAFLLERTKDRQPLADDGLLAEKLAECLGCLPLALEQAAAYINHRHRTLADYLDEFDNNTTKVLEWYDARIMTYPLSVATTWTTTLNWLGSREKALFRAAAFLSPDPIPVALFSRIADRLDGLVELWCEETGEPHKMTNQPEEALAELAAYSLIRWSGEFLSVHRMVQEVMRSRTPSERLPKWVEGVSQLLSDFAPSETAENPSTWIMWDILRPHAEALIKHSSSDSRIKANLTLMAHLCEHYFGKALYEEDLALSRKATDIAKTRFSLDSKELANWHLASGEALRMLQRPAEAEEMFRQSLAIRERVDGPAGSEYVAVLNYVALALKDQGKLIDAEDLWRKCVEMYQSITGLDEHDFGKCLNNLALLIQDKGDLHEAESLLRRAVEKQEHSVGTDHPHTLIAVANLGSLLAQKGHLKEGEVLLRRAVSAFESKQHPHLLIALILLCRILKDNSRCEEAESEYRRALGALERVKGSEHPDTLRAINNLAMLVHAKGDYSAAESLFRKALEGRQRALGGDHLDTLYSMNCLALTLQRKGDYASAEPLFCKTLDDLERQKGSEHPVTLTVINNLAMLVHAKGDYSAAESLFRKALEGRQRALGGDHLDTVQSLANLAETFRKQKRLNDAERLFLSAIATQEKIRGPEHPNVARFIYKLAQYLRDIEQHDRSARLYRDLLERQAESLDRVGTLSLEMLELMAISHNNLAFHTDVPAQNWEVAEEHYRASLNLFKQVGQPVEEANVELNLQTMFRFLGKTVDLVRVRESTRILDDAGDKRAEKGHKLLKELS